MESPKGILEDQAFRYVSIQETIEAMVQEDNSTLEDRRSWKGDGSHNEKADRVLRESLARSRKKALAEIRVSAEKAMEKLSEAVVALAVTYDEEPEVEIREKEISEACLALTTAASDLEKLRSL